jgi:hypothetical protein
MHRLRALPPMWIAAAALLAACQPTADPAPPVTLLVTNATCAAGTCQPLDVRGFITKFNVPAQPLGGFLALGRVNDASACLTFPPSFTLTVSGPTDTTKMTWTVADPVSLHASGVPFSPVGSTGEFVPASAAGWSVTFPSDGGAPGLTATTACTP